uniref:NADH-ubiquinone oxidoreductase chain 4 n=1 Tax=Phytoseiulus persimilis TaxID=44414 RepID=D5HKW2_PHYPM|nr:NADH dehydrogenase subunit 4 [Phytoseiulus persimilis]
MFINFFMLMMLMFSVYLSFFQNLFFFLMLKGLLVCLINFLIFKMMTLNSNYLFLDGLSYGMILLSYFIILFVLLYSYKDKLYKKMLIYYFMFISLYFCFSVDNFLVFYVFFELSMIPLLYLILMVSGSYERFKATMFLFIYTMLGSLTLLVFLMYLENNYSMMLNNVLLLMKNMGNYWGLMFLVFMIKSPLYGFHFWLPKAHVEAPIEGSMVLAGVLLKLGIFGFYRLMFFINNLGFINKQIKMLFIFSSLGSFIVGMICMRQVDLKLLIAYSSVSHMGLVMSGLLTMSKLGLSGSMLMLYAHGFCSSLMFFMGNMFYERYNTRNLFLFKGMAQGYPVLMIFWFWVILINMGVPPFMNFMSELFLIFSIIKKSFLMIFLLVFILSISVYYSLNLFMRIGHGKLWNVNFLKKESFLEMMLIIMHFMFLVLYILCMKNILYMF